MIYRLAGIVGVDPGPLTLRELVWMADGRGEVAWNHTAALLAAIYSGNPWLKKPRIFSPKDFNPYMRRKRDGLRLTKDTMSLFKLALLGPRMEKQANDAGNQNSAEAAVLQQPGRDDGG